MGDNCCREVVHVPLSGACQVVLTTPQLPRRSWGVETPMVVGVCDQCLIEWE